MKKWIKKVSLASLTIAAPILAISGGIVKANNNSNNVKISINYEYHSPRVDGTNGNKFETKTAMFKLNKNIDFNKYSKLLIYEYSYLSNWDNGNYIVSEYYYTFTIDEILNNHDNVRDHELTHWAGLARQAFDAQTTTRMWNNGWGQILGMTFVFHISSLCATTHADGIFNAVGLEFIK